MSRRWSLGVMIDTCLGICVQTRKHSGTACGHYSGDLIANQSFLIASTLTAAPPGSKLYIQMLTTSTIRKLALLT
ncbi:hypothetical protein ACTXT7_000973 [Hymenolepis weldensis]